MKGQVLTLGPGKLLNPSNLTQAIDLRTQQRLAV